jgi:hypothetical protein
MDMVTHACNPSTWEAETGISQTENQLGQHSKILSQNKTKDSQKHLYIYIYINFHVYIFSHSEEERNIIITITNVS